MGAPSPWEAPNGKEPLVSPVLSVVPLAPELGDECTLLNRVRDVREAVFALVGATYADHCAPDLVERLQAVANELGTIERELLP